MAESRGGGRRVSATAPERCSAMMTRHCRHWEEFPDHCFLPALRSVAGPLGGKEVATHPAEAFCVAVVAKEAHKTLAPVALLLKQAP